MNRIRKTFKKAFTLIELVVVIAVIAILSAVSVVTYIGVTDSANKSNAISSATQLRTLLLTELADGVADATLGNSTNEDHLTYANGTITESKEGVFTTVVTKIEEREGVEFGEVALKPDKKGFTLTTTSNYVATASFVGDEITAEKANYNGTENQDKPTTK